MTEDTNGVLFYKVLNNFMTTPTTKDEIGWEKEFTEFWIDGIIPYDTTGPDKEAVILWIRSLLTRLEAQKEEEVMGIIEGMKKETYATNKDLIYDTENVGWNSALSTLASVIKSKGKWVWPNHKNSNNT